MAQRRWKMVNKKTKIDTRKTNKTFFHFDTDNADKIKEFQDMMLNDTVIVRVGWFGGFKVSSY